MNQSCCAMTIMPIIKTIETLNCTTTNNFRKMVAEKILRMGDELLRNGRCVRKTVMGEKRDR